MHLPGKAVIFLTLFASWTGVARSSALDVFNPPLLPHDSLTHDSSFQPPPLFPFPQNKDSLLFSMPDSIRRIGDTNNEYVLDTAKYVPWSQYRWADHQMFTLTGDPPLRYTQIKPVAAWSYFGAYFGILAALHYYQEVTFWRNTQSFRIRDNFDESLSANYGGHFIGGYFVSYVSEQALLASGVSLKLAPIYGAIMGLGYQTYVEVLDGYGTDFSLSPFEVYSQTLGCVYYAASQYWPGLQDFSPKANYYPSQWMGDLPKAGSLTPIDDYSAWNFWLSTNIKDLTGWSFWPSWLNIAEGYGARNLGDPGERRVVSLALDYDLVKILPDGSPQWNWWRQTLDFLKLPAPGLEWDITRGGKSIGVYFYLAYPFIRL
jgi:hypothetical protein